MGAGSRALRAEKKLDPRKLPKHLHQRAFLQKKAQNSAAQSAQPTAGQLPPGTARGQMAGCPEVAQNTSISEEGLLTQSRADCEVGKVPRRRIVLERDSRSRQL